MITSTVGTYARMIKLSHSIFAMPFALASASLAAREHGWTWAQVGWIVVCMVSARSAAMGFNRIVDRDIDAKNPRTAIRELPSGQIGLGAAVGFTAASAAIFVLGAAMLGPICLKLSPVALAVVLGYSLTKRFTALCHLVLGVALAIAPIAAWLAIAGQFSWISALLAAIVATWVAGFDIIYACQDADFDRQNGLNSIPAKLGVRGALWVSGGLHVLTVAGLVALPLLTPLAWPYWVGVLAMGGILAYEHAIVKPDDLSKVDKAFFDLNGYVSLAFLAVVLLAR